MDSEPNKVRIIEIPLIEKDQNHEQDTRDKKFQKYVKELPVIKEKATNGQEILEKSCNLIADSIIHLTQMGRLNPNKSGYFLGDSLKWSRMGYSERKKAIEYTLLNSLKENGETILDNNLALMKIKNKKVLLKCQAIPDSLSISEAKELVGQPFLIDYQNSEIIQKKGAIGPIHLIGCYKSITESQARKILGFPNATLVKAPFGIYLADNIQMIQIIFLQDCRNETETVNVLQRFFSWLNQSGEIEYLFERADKRRKIVKTIYDIQNQ